MSTPTETHAHATVTSHAKVKRSTRSSWAGLGIAVPVVLFMAAAPYIIDRGFQQQLVTLFSLVVLATMWNLLAGYGGMVSVGQQAYIGIGAYGLVYLADTLGLDPFLAVPLSVIIAGLLSIPISFLAFRLVGGYFAIGTWVIAEVVKQITMQVDALGAGIGLSLTSLNELSPGRRIAYVYWLSLAAVVIAVAVTYFLMRSRLGLGFTAIRDDQVAASSLGVRVTHSKRFVFVVSAMGCALAGGMIAANTLRITPDSIYSVNFSAFMIFMVIIGGIGTIEGPIVGAIVFFALQEWLSDLGTWYLIIIGVLAIVITLFLPRGLWGLISGNGRIRLFPVGYRLVNPIERFGRHPD
ncbi:MAG: branched-chain amino acid ABC transporter permease [Actinomycetales bacterium]|nr:branched-chain amino acid ABC transporter permease [Actinomycetales bacterium]